MSDLPIHVELNAFVTSPYQDMLEYAASRWEECYAFPKANARAYMDKTLNEGNGILLLDALDATVVGEQAEADASYMRAWNAIMRITARFPQATIVVTARKAGYHQHKSLDGFTELEVMDFQRDDIRRFIENWFRCSQGMSPTLANANDLIQRLEQNPRIQALAANPLLLSLIVLVYEAQLDLPDRRAELYKRCVDVLLTEWDAKRSIRRRRVFKPEHKRQLLAEVAWYFHLQGLRYFPERDLLREIARFLPALGLQPEESKSVLLEIANENGLLKEQAHGWYGFLHLTLQEYFVAQYINDQQEQKALLSRCGDPWWEEVLLLYVGYTTDASFIIQSLLGKTPSGPKEDDLFHTNLLTAGKCLGARPTIRTPMLREEVTTQLFELLKSTRYALIRERILSIITGIDSNITVPKILQLIRDPQVDVNVRGAIVAALGDLKERSIVSNLFLLLKDPQVNLNIRRVIASVLAKIGEQSMIPDLLELLRDPQVDVNIRGTIAYTLGNFEERSLVPDLIGLLRDPHVEANVRSSIAYTLRGLKERSFVPDLLVLLRDPQVDTSLRNAIASALGNLGERSVVPDLLALLNDPQLT